MQDIQSICVYCSASDRVDGVYKEAALETGKALGDRGIKMVFGGGAVGLMAITAKSAMESGGHVLGFMPKHLCDFEAPNEDITELHMVDSMHERKQKMFEQSDAFFVLPGGFGTLDEAFEMITWRQIGLHEKPVIFININNYWDPLRQLTRNIIGQGFAQEKHLSYFSFVNSVEDAFSVLSNLPKPEKSLNIDWM